jgi:hypothetical protein
VAADLRSIHRRPPELTVTSFGALGGRDAYDVLGIAPTATDREIEQARRRLQLRHHPDRQGDPAESAAVNVAAEILLDARTRADYDAFRSGPPAGDSHAAAPASTAWDGASEGLRPAPPPPPPPPPAAYYPPPGGPAAYPPHFHVAVPPMPPPPVAGGVRSSPTVGLIIAASIAALVFLACICGFVEMMASAQPVR